MAGTGGLAGGRCVWYPMTYWGCSEHLIFLGVVEVDAWSLAWGSQEGPFCAREAWQFMSCTAVLSSQTFTIAGLICGRSFAFEDV